VRCVTSSGLVERETELQALTAVVEEVRSGRGGLVVVEGPAGIGKSRLLDAVAHRGAAAGARVLRARGGILERDVAYGAVRQLLERFLATLPDDERADVLSGAAAHALPALAPAATAGTGEGPAAATEHGLFWMVAHLAERAPLVLVLDDAHWFDAASLRFVVYLVRRLVDLPVVVAVGMRPDDSGAAAPDLLAELLLEPGAVLLRPAPLSVSGIGSLLVDRMGPDVAPEFAASCHHAVGGNPFLLTQLAGALVADGAEPTAANAPRVREVRPRTIARAILLRLARLPAGATELAQALAVLGSSAGADLVAALAGVEPSAAGPVLDTMVADEILAGDLALEFAHPVVREAVYAELGAAERVRWHQRAADLLVGTGADAERVAPHLLVTRPAARPDTVAVLREAARTATERGAPDIALRYLERALAEPTEGDVRADVLVETGTAGFHAGAPADGPRGQLREALGLIVEPEKRLDVWLALSRVTAMESSVPGSVAVLEEALADLAALAPETLAPLFNELCGFGITHPDTIERAVARLPAVPPASGEALTARLALCNLAALSAFRGDPAVETDRLARTALAHGQLIDDLGAGSNMLHQFAFCLAATDPPDPWVRVETLALERAQESGSAFAITGALGTRAFTSFLRGDLVEAQGDAELALTVPGVPPFVLPAISGFVCLALVERDDLVGAEEVLARAGLGPELPEILHMTFAYWARSRLRSAQGRWADALDDLEEFGRRAERVQLRTPVFPWLSDAALVLARLGRLEEAAPYADQFDERARRLGTARVLGASARTRGLLAGDRAGRELLEEAVGHHTGSPARLELAHSLVELGAAERRAGERRRAIETLGRAAEQARSCGATRLLRRVHEELGLAGVSGRPAAVAGVESLTPGELRVARMAAAGHTNRQVAEALFVSAKTVENHLGRVYTKLGIVSRTALPDALGDPETSAGGV
jgi:DNA-binding CsgD family transcriptional regulator